MNKICPNCKKGILVTDSKRKSPRFRRCKQCKYKEQIGIPVLREKKYETTKEGVPKLEAEDIPELQEKLSKKKYLSKMTDKESLNLWEKNERSKMGRRQASIEKILKELRRNKYGVKKGTKIRIGGKLYEV